jgi:hypothetical protein
MGMNICLREGELKALLFAIVYLHENKAMFQPDIKTKTVRQGPIATNTKQKGNFLKVTSCWRINLCPTTLLGGR